MLELKIRNNKTKEGIENWSKIIRKNFESFDILTIINNSDNNSNNEIKINLNGIFYSLNLVKTLEIIKKNLSSFNNNEILNYLKSFDNFPFGFVLTFKNRYNNNFEEDVMIKSYYFAVSGTKNETLEAKSCFKRSFCIENEVNKNLIDNLNKKLKDYIIAGYPEELLSMLIKNK